MKLQHLIPILFLAASCTASAQTNTAPTESKSIKLDNRGVPVGTLGFPVGTYLTIEAVWQAPPQSVICNPQDFWFVDTVNGGRLAKPVEIMIETTNSYHEGVRFTFKGYETCKMMGIAPGEEEAYKESGQRLYNVQCIVTWHLQYLFEVTSVVASKKQKH